MRTEFDGLDALEIRRDEIDRLDLRAVESRETIGSMPRIAAHAGTVYLAVLVALVVAAAWLIKYPDIIAARVTLPAARSITTVVARVNPEVARSGALQAGQRVRIRFRNLQSAPSEGGGVVQNIIVSADSCNATIRLDHHLPARGEATNVDLSIVTNEERLLARMLLRLRERLRPSPRQT